MKRTYSIDVSYYGRDSYQTLQHSVGDRIKHNPVWNLNLGAEMYLKSWLALRFGAYTNFSSHPKIKATLKQRQGDHIDMWGFSTNLAIFTSEKSKVTLGGYYTGGKGHSSQEVGGQIIRLPKSVQMFSFLVGTSFNF